MYGCFTFVIFLDMVSLNSLAQSITHYVAQTHRNLPSSASQVLVLRVCTTSKACFDFVYFCELHAYVVPKEARSEHHISWYWSYR